MPRPPEIPAEEFAADEELGRREAHAAHMLVPEDLAPNLPALYSQEDKGEEAIAVLKFLTPWTSWTWYASEYDPEERIFFGVVVGHERELGYFSRNELEAIRGPGGLRIERDLYWKPRPLRECR